jgi:hypothetical protein
MLIQPKGRSPDSCKKKDSHKKKREASLKRYDYWPKQITTYITKEEKRAYRLIRVCNGAQQ